MRVSAWTWPFPFGVCLGWATCNTRNPPETTARGRAFFLRGQGIVFSGGFGRLCEAQRREGWWAEDLRCVGDWWMRLHLLAEQRTGRLRGPLVMVGHSCGGRYATYSAGVLAKAGVSIDLLVCVDVAGPFPIPGNVRQALNIYRSRGRFYPARPLLAAPGASPSIENLDLDAPGSPIAPAGLHHMNMTDSPAVQELIRTRIAALVG
jgi:hypothetical protein